MGGGQGSWLLPRSARERECARCARLGPSAKLQSISRQRRRRIGRSELRVWTLIARSEPTAPAPLPLGGGSSVRAPTVAGRGTTVAVLALLLRRQHHPAARRGLGCLLDHRFWGSRRRRWCERAELPREYGRGAEDSRRGDADLYAISVFHGAHLPMYGPYSKSNE